MAVLPFVVQPRRVPIKELIGSEESGQIEVERRGYLTTGEKSFVQQVQQYDNGTNEIIGASRRVSGRYKIPLDKAYKFVMMIVSGNHLTDEENSELLDGIEKDFAEDLTAIVRGMAVSQTREELVFAACMLKYRVNQDFEISEIADVHPDIIEGLAELYRQEDAKILDAFEKESKEENKEPTVEEIEKKPKKGARSPSTNTTGFSSEDSQETQSSD